MTRIIIFAKAPAAGLAKTRLIPVLGAEGAARLAKQMLDRTVSCALATDVGRVELCMTPAGEHAAWRGVALPVKMERTTQGDGDLGARLAEAARRSIERGEMVVLIGTDCVEMSTALLTEAVAQLQVVDAVIHPTVDGGYALLGLRWFHPSLFTVMPWSTSTVASATIHRMTQLGWSIFVGSVLHDIDEPGDLGILAASPSDEGGAIAAEKRPLANLQVSGQRLNVDSGGFSVSDCRESHVTV